MGFFLGGGGSSLLIFSFFTPLQHVTAEGTALVKLAEDAASNKKVFIVLVFTSISLCMKAPNGNMFTIIDIQFPCKVVFFII